MALQDLMDDTREPTWDDVEFYAQTGLDLISEGEDFGRSYPRSAGALRRWRDRAQAILNEGGKS